MLFFGKSKKNDKNKANVTETIEKTPGAVYNDGVFEVFFDEESGKKFARILKYHGSDKVFEISDDEFEMWKDASQNYGKYRITYERDEEYFIEKATIELAAPLKEEKEPEPPVLTPEQSQQNKHLIDFYNRAVTSPDFGKKQVAGATLEEAFATCVLCDRKILDFSAKAKQNTPAGERIQVKIPESVAKLSEYARKILYTRISELETVFAVYSTHTKRQHSAGGNALVALNAECAEKIRTELSEKNQDVYIKEIPKESLSAEITDIILNGLSGIRFLYNGGLATVIRVQNNDLDGRVVFPENIKLRGAMTAFFQDLKNGIPQEKLKSAELVMYESMFRATFIQPCAKKAVDDETLGLSVSIIRDNQGNCLMDLFSSVEIMENSQSYKTFIENNPENYGYKKWSFDELLAEIKKENSSVTGFTVDKDLIPAPFVGQAIEKMSQLKELWDKNGGSFAKKQEE